MRTLLRLYPAAWRNRYGEEMTSLLADLPSTPRAVLDLVRGALDAHLHPMGPLLWPAIAASIGGIAWTFAAAVALGQPVPPEWPGYLEETLPIQLAATSLIVLGVIGASTRLGDVESRLATVGRPLAVLGGGAWIALLVLAMLRLAYGWPVAVASSIVAIGAAALALALARAGDRPVADLIVLAAAALVIPMPWLSIGFGAAWVAVAVAELRSPRPFGDRWRGSAG
ncbi:MAG TPA: hypothetical protein VFK54_01405 [Candidatus Limnocylindrales bacterium]|nr:hypothetical protein [Candidatus Limnocylindrales bacterium]